MNTIGSKDSIEMNPQTPSKIGELQSHASGAVKTVNS